MRKHVSPFKPVSRYPGAETETTLDWDGRTRYPDYGGINTESSSVNSSPTSPVYSPTSPVYSPTSPVFVRKPTPKICSGSGDNRAAAASKKKMKKKGSGNRTFRKRVKAFIRKPFPGHRAGNKHALTNKMIETHKKYVKKMSALMKALNDSKAEAEAAAAAAPAAPNLAQNVNAAAIRGQCFKEIRTATFPYVSLTGLIASCNGDERPKLVHDLKAEARRYRNHSCITNCLNHFGPQAVWENVYSNAPFYNDDSRDNIEVTVKHGVVRVKAWYADLLSMPVQHLKKMQIKSPVFEILKNGENLVTAYLQLNVQGKPDIPAVVHICRTGINEFLLQFKTELHRRCAAEMRITQLFD